MRHELNLSKMLPGLPLFFLLLPLPAPPLSPPAPPCPSPFSCPSLSLYYPTPLSPEIIQTLPSQLGVDDVEDFCTLARYFSSLTPQSFRKVSTLLKPLLTPRLADMHALCSWEPLMVQVW